MRSEYEAGFMAEEALYVVYDCLKMINSFSDTSREEWAKKWNDDGLEVEIVPCNSKINVNTLITSVDRKRALEILRNILPQGSDFKTMAGSLGVWIGKNIDPKLEKFDKFFYASQLPSYSTRRSKLKLPEEILLVRGWGDLGRDWVDENITVWELEGSI